MYAITRAQKAQVSILGAPPNEPKEILSQRRAKIGDYLDPVVEQAKLVAIQNWINEDRRKYEEKRASQALDLQSEGGIDL